ncbi:MAG: hypothetical protein WKF84_27685 [Pyrinomonadaceae bacterium]
MAHSLLKESLVIEAHHQLARRREKYLGRIDTGMCAGVISGGICGAALLGDPLGYGAHWLTATALAIIVGMFAGLVGGIIIGLATVVWSEFKWSKHLSHPRSFGGRLR